MDFEPTTIEQWPYGADIAGQTLDPSVIESHARVILARSLNVGRVIAFVGSGVSIRQGRMGWPELAYRLQCHVLARYDAFASARKKANTPDDELWRQIQSTHASVKCVAFDDLPSPSVSNPDRLPTLVQLCEHLEELLRSAMEGRSGDPSLREIIAQWLESDSHTDSMVSRWAHDPLSDGVVDPSRSFAMISFAKSSIGVVAALDGQADEFDEDETDAARRELSHAIERFVTLGGADQLAPQYKFLAGVASLLGAPPRQSGQRRKRAPEPKETSPPIPDFGPLSILYRDLGIRRYLTTNYDREIERFMAVQGFMGAGQEVQDAFGAEFRSHVFAPADASQLVAFATRTRSSRVELVHLHGRTSEPESLVLTERDYKERYFSEDKFSVASEEALSLALGGNPLLFVGMGMGEDELLRPLRLREALDHSAGDRPCIAVLPRLQDARDTATKKAVFLLRYGIHTIHYGVGSFAPGEVSSEITLHHWIRVADLAGNLGARLLQGDGRASASLGAELLQALNACAREMGDDGMPSLHIPTHIDGVPLSTRGLEEVEPCLKALEAGVRALLRLSRSGAAEPRLVRAASEMVKGASAGLISSCLCACLQRIGVDWAAWRRDWFREPPFRAVIPSRVADDQSFEDRRNVVRALGGAGEHSQSVQAFIDALRTIHDEEFRANQGRRAVLIVARRGVGKGQFFESFVDTARMLPIAEKLTDGGSYAARGIYNLSFSHEVASTFDRITRLLERAYPEVFGKDLDQIVPEKRYDRQAALQSIVAQYAENTTRPTKRVLIAINGFGMMFDRDGIPKNGLVAGLTEALLGAHSVGAPIDLILTVSDKTIPYFFRHTAQATDDAFLARAHEMTPLKAVARPGLSAKGALEINQWIETAGLNVCWRSWSDVPPVSWPTLAPRRTGMNLVHYLRESRASEIAWSSFGLAGVMFVAATTSSGGQNNPVAEKLRQSAVRRLMESWPFPPGCLGAGMTGEKYPARFARWIFEGDDSAQPEELAEAERVIDRMFRRLYEGVGRSRFNVTLVLSTIQALLRDGCSRDITPDLLTGNVQRVAAFVSRTLLAMASVEEESRADGVLSHVRRALSELVEPEAILRPSAERQDDGARVQAYEVFARHAQFNNLLWLLIWHSAVVGAPLKSATLSRCPEIRELIARIYGGARTDADYQGVVEACLRGLTRLSLIFVIAPKQQGDKGELSYAVHRQVQRYVLRRLNAPLLEYPDVDHFTFSMYPSQPSELPRPSEAAHRRLRRLLNALSFFPTANPDRWASTGQIAPLERSRMLRAAFGLLRTVYSIGLLVRFDAYSSSASASGHGHLEQHRLHIRWLLKQAQAFKVEGGEADEDCPFYPDEIAWLYNECGLISFIEGRMNDAVALYGNALSIVRRFETGERGPITLRVTLNRALADIERGALRRARVDLTRIWASEKEHPALRYMALGYLGLTDHLSGNWDHAEKRYKEAAAWLASNERTRGASIFLRHLSDLQRARGGWRLDDAEETIRRSIAHASEGGHEDVRQYARLAQALLWLQGNAQDRQVEIASILDAAERYATVMGIPKMMIDVLTLRGALLARQGELLRAAKIVRQGLERAQSNDLRLRKVSSLILLSRIYAAQGLQEVGMEMFRRATDLAKEADYGASIGNTEAVMGVAGWGDL